MAWRRYRFLLSQTSQAHKLRKMLLAQGDFQILEAWSLASAEADNDKKILPGSSMHFVMQKAMQTVMQIPSGFRLMKSDSRLWRYTHLNIG